MLRHEFVRFCIVGAAGFAVDAGLTLLFTSLGLLSPLPARVLAFLAAAATTWLLHHHFTFKVAQAARGWPVYLALTTLIAGVNVGIYLLWLRWWGESPLHILLGICWGAAVALVMNYSVSKHVVFKPGLSVP